MMLTPNEVIKEKRDYILSRSSPSYRTLMNQTRLPIRVARRLVQPVDLIHEIHSTAAILEILPLSAIPDSKNIIIHSNGAALINPQSRSPVEARAQHVDAQTAALGRCAVVQLVEGHAVLERAFLHEFAAGDVFVLVGHAHDEAEVDFRAGVVARRAELEHVA